MKNDICFISCFAPYMEAFIKEKKSLGFKYDTENRILHHFDRYCLGHCHELVFDEKLVQGYIFSDENRSINTRQNIIGHYETVCIISDQTGFKSLDVPS